MSELINTIIETREKASKIMAESLMGFKYVSEVDMREKVISQTAHYGELYPKGWYDPPPSGVGILFDEEPFDRLKFDSLRDTRSWPSDNSLYKDETVGIFYMSPVDKETSMIGDIGFTVYSGEDIKIKEHINKSYKTTLSIAEHSKVGMKFSELYDFATNLFKDNLKIVGWMTTTSDPLKGVNLGHTIPGSLEENIDFGSSFEEVREIIKTKRIYINKAEDFMIPPTCAFTVEARLADINDESLPNTFFHFIVTFDDGEKKILKNFNNIFEIANMDYMKNNYEI